MGVGGEGRAKSGRSRRHLSRLRALYTALSDRRSQSYLCKSSIEFRLGQRWLGAPVMLGPTWRFKLNLYPLVSRFPRGVALGEYRGTQLDGLSAGYTIW